MSQTYTQQSPQISLKFTEFDYINENSLNTNNNFESSISQYQNLNVNQVDLNFEESDEQLQETQENQENSSIESFEFFQIGQSQRFVRIDHGTKLYLLDCNQEDRPGLYEDFKSRYKKIFLETHVQISSENEKVLINSKTGLEILSIEEWIEVLMDFHIDQLEGQCKPITSLDPFKHKYHTDYRSLGISLNEAKEIIGQHCPNCGSMEFDDHTEARLFMDQLFQQEDAHMLRHTYKIADFALYEDNSDTILVEKIKLAENKLNGPWKHQSLTVYTERWLCECNGNSKSKAIDDEQLASDLNQLQMCQISANGLIGQSLKSQSAKRTSGRVLPMIGNVLKVSHKIQCKRYISLSKKVFKSGEEVYVVNFGNSHKSQCSELGKNAIHSAVKEWLHQMIRAGFKNQQILDIFYQTDLDDLSQNRIIPRPQKPETASASQWCLSEKDVKNARQKFLSESRFDQNDRKSVELFLSERSCGLSASQIPDNLFLQKHNPHIIYYQDQICKCEEDFCKNTKQCQPFLVVLQPQFLRQQALNNANQLQSLYMDSTGTTNIYRYPLTALMYANEQGKGMPLAFMISSSEAASTYTQFLNVLRSSCPWAFQNNQVIMIDKSDSEIKGIKDFYGQSFQNSNIAICFFHVQQAWVRWMKRSVNNVKEQHREIILEKINFMTTSQRLYDFYKQRQALLSYLDRFQLQKVKVYFQKEWDSYKVFWARCFRGNVNIGVFDNRTNNICEAFFKVFKKDILGNKMNSRLDDLLKVLCDQIDRYFEVKLKANIKVNNAKINEHIRSIAGDAKYLLMNNNITRKNGDCFVSEVDDAVFSLSPPRCSCIQRFPSLICAHILALIDIHGQKDFNQIQFVVHDPFQIDSYGHVQQHDLGTEDSTEDSAQDNQISSQDAYHIQTDEDGQFQLDNQNVTSDIDENISVTSIDNIDRFQTIWKRLNDPQDAMKDISLQSSDISYITQKLCMILQKVSLCSNTGAAEFRRLQTQVNEFSKFKNKKYIGYITHGKRKKNVNPTLSSAEETNGFRKNQRRGRKPFSNRKSAQSEIQSQYDFSDMVNFGT